MDLLRRLERRSGMYMGGEDVRTLRDFAAGYYLALVDRGEQVSNRFLIEFGRWLAASDEGGRTGATPDTPWWVTVALIDPSEKNIRTFYRLFRPFLAETGRPPL